MNGGHEELQVLAGAFALGGLSDEDHRAFSAHLRDCAICQREVGQLGAIPRLLSLVDESALPDGLASIDTAAHSPVVSAGAPVDLLARLRARRRQTRWGLVAAAAALIAVSVGGGVWWGQASARPTAATVALTAVPVDGASAQASVGLVTKGWGTQLEVAASDLPRTGTFTLVVVDSSGTETQIGTWSATPSGQATLVAASAARTADIRAVQIRTAAGETLASARG